MTGYSIAEEYTLPSKGLVYTTKINPVIKIRSMTTEEEMKRLSKSDRQYKTMCEIIDDCLLENPGISAYDMCIADYQFLLHRLRVVTYGSEYNTTSRCPYCECIEYGTLDLDMLEVKECDLDEIQSLFEFTLPKTGKRIRIALQTPRMIDDISAHVAEDRKKSKGKAADNTFIYTLQSLISSVDGEHLDPVKLEDFVRKLPMMDTNYIIKHAEKLVESFGVVPTVSTTCSVCGLDYTNTFRFSREFFGPTVDI